MADVTVTSLSVTSQLVVKQDVKLGETCASGEVVYRKASDDKYYKGDADASDAEATSRGLLLNGGILDDFVLMVTIGPVVLNGSTLVKGDAYYLSGTAGKIMPQDDLAVGDRVSYLGNATSTTVLDVNIKNYLTLL